MSNRMILNFLALLATLAGAIVLSCPFTFSSSPIEIYVSPQPISVNEYERFSVCVNIGNLQLPGVYGYQMTLVYGAGCLEAINASVPDDHFLTPSSSMNIFLVDKGTIDNELGKVSFCATLLGDELAKTGSGVVACVEFEAVARGNSPLTFADVILVDRDCNEIPSSHIVLEPGNVDIAAGPPPPPSSLFKVYVSPQNSIVNEGQNFSVSINIARAPLPGIFAYKFSLSYNSTNLEAVTAAVPKSSFLETSASETFLVAKDGTIDNVSGAVSFEVSRLAPEEGKTGRGVLGCVEFLAATSGYSYFTIIDISLLDQDGNIFPSSQYEQVRATVVVTGVVVTPDPPHPPPPPTQYGSIFVRGANNSQPVSIEAWYSNSTYCSSHLTVPSTGYTWTNVTTGSYTVHGKLGDVERTTLVLVTASSTLVQAVLKWTNGEPPPPSSRAELRVRPRQNSTEVGDSLQVDILIANVPLPGLYAYEITLCYDYAHLEAIAAEIPQGHFLTPLFPENIFIVDNGIIDGESGKVSFAVTLLGPEDGKTGDGLLATVQFKAISEGDLAFRLENVVLGGPDVGGILGYEETPGIITVVPEFELVTMLPVLLLLATLVGAVVKKRKPRGFK